MVDAVAVGDQRAGEGADLEQLVPVAAGPGEPRHLEPEHQADTAEPDLGHQALGAGPPLGRGAGAAEVVVDDADARPRPARAVGPLGEPVLRRGRLAVLLQLLQRGLAGGDGGQPVKVAGLDPARQHQVGPALRRRPHGPPPLPAPGAPSASGAAAPGGRSGRPASGAWSTAARAKAGSPRRSLALPRHTAIQRASASSASALAITSQSTSFAEVLRAGFGPLPYHPSVLPDAPEGRERDEELQEALDAAQATPEEGGPAAGHLPRPLRRGFFSAGKG